MSKLTKNIHLKEISPFAWGWEYSTEDQKETIKKFIDLIFCTDKNGQQSVVASTKNKYHTLIGDSISEGKCGGRRPKKISYNQWNKWKPKKKICVSGRIEEDGSEGYGTAAFGGHAIMTTKKEACEFFNRFEAKYDRKSKRFYYEDTEVTQIAKEESSKKQKVSGLEAIAHCYQDVRKKKLSLRDGECILVDFRTMTGDSQNPIISENYLIKERKNKILMAKNLEKSNKTKQQLADEKKEEEAKKKHLLLAQKQAEE